MRRRPLKVGVAFSDFVEQENFFFPRKKGSTAFHASQILIIAPFFILICVFIVLLLRLFYIQIIQGPYYKTLAEENRTRTIIIPAPRGIIFDRYKRPLVRNVPTFEILEKGRVRLLDKDEALKLIKEGEKVTQTVSREYLYKSTFAHVLGYIGQISEEEINHPDFKNYVISDFVGKMGLEYQYEKTLHGTNGRQLYEVNAKGQQIRFLGSNEATAGRNIETTLDIDLQEASEKALEKTDKGAVVVSDPRDGSILALYSKPTFDSNLFTHGKNYEAEGEYKDIDSILNDTDKQPLLDRAIGGAYPPGSAFKLVTAAAALESGAIKPDTVIEDTGVLTVGEFSFGNWYYLQYGRREGDLNIVGAIKRSNDIFFYQTAQRTGVDNIGLWAHKFGLGKALGIDIPGETTGTVPTEEWKKETVGEPWYLGDTFNYGIGQGYLLTTPLQVNFWTSVFANEGTLFQPHLIKGKEKKLKEKVVKKEYTDLIRQGMLESCERGGVAWPLFDFKVKSDRLRIDNLNYFDDASSGAKMVRVKIGCKTGTAEIGDKETKPHAWITAFAPFYNPEIVLTVLVENGGEGSSVAGPIARDILKEYFEKR